MEYADLFNKALEYKKQGDFEKAIEYYEKVLKLKPDLNEAYFNLAYLKFNTGHHEEAIECYKKVLQINPDDLESQYFLALTYMQTMDYENGLKFFESRLCKLSSILSQKKTYPDLITNLNIWQGEDISDKVLYTYYEAGFGDLIMFARYLPILEKRCKKVIFKPKLELVELFQENFPNIQFLKYFNADDNIKFDVHLPFLSLPYALGLTGEELFISKDKYLTANKKLAETYKQKYFDNNKFKIGIKWQGNTYYDKERVIKTESFFPLFEIPNTKFYSLQTFEGAEEIEKIKAKYDIDDIGKTFKNFADTAAAVENLDLIISNDSSLAHIAGAMGKPCYILLPKVYNWRWHIDLSKCDWYSSVKLFRQKNANNWDEVFEEVQQSLSKDFKLF